METLINWGSASGPAGGNDSSQTPSYCITLKYLVGVQGNALLGEFEGEKPPQVNKSVLPYICSLLPLTCSR